MNNLTRPISGRMLAGVCAGLAVRFDLDPSLVRVAFVVLGFLTGIFPFVALYVILAVIVPETPGWGGVPPVEPSAAWWAPNSAPPAPGQPSWSEPPPWDARDARDARREERDARRAARHDDPTFSILAGVFLVGIGVFFLVRNAFGIDWELIWPGIVVTLGILVVIAGLRPRHPGA